MSRLVVTAATLVLAHCRIDSPIGVKWPVDADGGREAMDTVDLAAVFQPTSHAGTLFDASTGLTWQERASSVRHDWSRASQYCSTLFLSGGGWRLPTVEELRTVVDSTRRDPAIDLAAFPDTPSAGFWTQSPSVAPSGFYQYVDFATGGTSQAAVATELWVRCVR